MYVVGSTAVKAQADKNLQNKDKPKKGHLPQQMMDSGNYLAAKTVGDVWICYPWEATYEPSSSHTLCKFTDCNSDIDEHDRMAAKQPA
jgi:hypothetical protein